MNEYRAAQLLCLICSAHAMGAIIAIPALWLGQSINRIALAYGLGGSIPVAVVTAIQVSLDKESHIK
jgi:hypothetical protein